MFMPARELYDMHSLDTSGYGGDVGAMRRGKRQTNRVGKMGRSIQEEGVRKPVLLAHGDDPQLRPFRGGNTDPVVLANGNHRVIAAHDHDPDTEIPVEHYDSADKLYVAMRRQDQSKW